VVALELPERGVMAQDVEDDIGDLLHSTIELLLRFIPGVVDKRAIDVQANLMLILVLGEMFPWLLL